MTTWLGCAALILVVTAAAGALPTSSLGDYGFDSLTMKSLGDRLANRFGVDFSPTVFFERSGVRGAASWLVEEYGASLSAVVGPAPVAVASPGGVTSVVPAPVVEPSGDAEPIAIIGMSGRFPGAPDVETFWANLCERRDLVTEIPPERWDWRALDDPGLPPERRCPFKWGAFLDGVDEFDPLFFGISPAEAEMMDPQQRLLLQTAWAAFEDAGYRPSSFAGHPVGLFAGIQFNDYQHLLHEAGVLNAQAALGNEHSIAVNRISYLLDLHGPSEPVNTACSSSLVAVHRAVQSLRRGESTLALAGGVALNLSSHSTMAAGMMGLLSPDGRCKTLDSGANGYVKGEGVGLLLLKPLSRALRDRDHIHAVIRGTAVNHGGRAASLTAPNSAAQSDLVRAAVADAGVEPETIGYLELHGTGTELGDPIEIDGLNRAFRALRAENHLGAPDAPYCGIGSVKTNIGHLEPASGIAGLIKVIQSAKHRKLPGMAHLTELNPYVRLDGSPFYVVEETQQWSAAVADGGPVPLRAGVSSFGFGGVNAHVVLEEHPVVPVFAASGREHVFVLSARTAEAVTEQAVRLVERIDTWLATDAVPDPAAVAATLQHGREEFAHRAAVVATGIEDLRRKLTVVIEAGSSPDVHRGRAEEGVSPEGDSPLDMARGWVRGAPVKWPEGPQVKVSLPTYPFARTRHWFTASRTPEGGRESGLTGTDVTAEQRVRGALRAILTEKLKLRESELEDDRDLKEFGVDSMLSATITTLVQQHFGVQVSVTALVEHPTVADLAEHILHDLLGGQAPAAGAVDVLPSSSPSSTAASYPPELIPINTTGDGQASFWVHGAAGYAARFDALSRALGPEYPLYAFQAKGTDGFSMPHLLDEMANHYVECIRLVQPHGPYVIGGYSFGGLVAMEMARRLQRDGETVRHLIMFDTYPATQEVFDRHEGIYDADFLTYYLINYLLRIDDNPERAIRPAELEHVPASLREQALSKLAKERGDKFISAEDVYLYLRGGLNCSAHAEGIYQTFEMRPYDASDVLFLKATDGFTGRASAAYWKSVRILDGYDYLSPWRHVVDGAFDVVELDSDHLNLLAAPTLDEAARRIVNVLRTPPEFDPDEYARFRSDFDAVTACGHDLLAATLGASIHDDGTTRADLAATLGVGERRAQRRLLDACIDVLEREGYVDERDGRLRRTAKGEKVRPEAVHAEAALVADRVGAATDYVPLLVAAQRDLPAVLSGEKQGTDVLMPGGSTHLVAELYKSNVQTEFYNRLVADQVVERAGRHVRRFPRSTVQVFEVGAGTGGTSEFVFDALGSIGQSSRYFFTDIGAAFVEDARRRFSDRVPGAEFCVFDIERAAEGQGFEPHSMDVVVASNVLHATRDIRTTLANCARLLKPSGVLIVNELTRRLDYNTLTFGLTDGWWLFEDEDVRIPGSPLLAAATWRRMLREAGLSDIDVHGVPGVQEEEQAQCVVVARHEPTARVQ